MTRLRVWKLDEDATDIILHVMLESDDGKMRIGGVDVTLAKTVNAAQVQVAIVQAHKDIEAVPDGGVEDMAKAVVDRINEGLMP